MNIIPINKEFLTTAETAEILTISKQALMKKKDQYEYKKERHPGGFRLLFKTESIINNLNPERRLKIYSQFTPEELAERKLLEDELAIYSNVPDWKKKKVTKYLAIFNAAEGYYGKELEEFINEWNKKHPEDAVSVKSYYREFAKYKDGGVQALYAGYGNHEGETIIDDEDFNYFSDQYLKEGGPTLKSCWLETYGNNVRRNYGIIPDNFPSMNSFLRILKKRVPLQSIERIRKGEKYWNRNYATFMERDWSNVKAGQCWFSDHRQADQAVIRNMPKDAQEQILRLIKYDGNNYNKPVFPWITFWADAKTKKMLSILPHEDAPNSDHIFLSFYMAIDEYGLPDEIYIDNGKDYRAKDFAGGKRKVRVEIDEVKTRSLMSYLGIVVHFSKPYRGQSKTIERTFGVMKNWLDKQMPGYRGGNIVERPEKLAGEIKRGEIMDFVEYAELLYCFFKNIANKFESQGQILKGKSPDQVWAEEFKIKRTVGKESLKLLCMRSSKDYSITRNGIVVSEKHRLHYWGDWMIALKGSKEKYYMRRDPKQYQYAWVFNARTDEYVGKAELNVWKTAALAKTDLEKAQLQAALRRQKLEKNIVESYTPQTKTNPRELLENLAAGIAVTSKNNENEKAEVMTVFVRTTMDEVTKKQEEIQKTGTYGFSGKEDGKKSDKPVMISYLTNMEKKEAGQTSDE